MKQRLDATVSEILEILGPQCLSHSESQLLQYDISELSSKLAVDEVCFYNIE